MALYCTRSSSGISGSTASISDDLPAAEENWISTASGLSSLRYVAAI